MKCRHCGNLLKYTFADLDSAPPSNAYLDNLKDIENEVNYPLKTYVCEKCWLVQTKDFVASEKLFNSKYAYVSSASETWKKHCKNYSQMIIDKLSLDDKSLVVEIASNDGCLLENFQDKIPCYGIEPTAEVARLARDKGISTHEEFFTLTYAKELAEKGKADLICGNNVYAHVPDINDFTAGIYQLLKNTGTVTLEFPHLVKLIKHNQFDTIYHEHFSYLSLTTVKNIFSKYNLDIYDVEELPTHGGSLRIYGSHTSLNKKITNNVKNILLQEEEFGIKEISTYTSFQKKIEIVVSDFVRYIKDAKNKNLKIAGYGAAAKGNTLLNFSKISNKEIDFVCDASPLKINTLLPGSHIPVHDISALSKYKPDIIIILPWNISREIVNILNNVNNWGAVYVSFIPSTINHK